MVAALHASNNTLLTITLVLAILIGIVWLAGRYR